MKLTLLVIIIIICITVGFYPIITNQKCIQGKGEPLLTRCNKNTIKGLKTFHLFCRCTKCNEAPEACNLGGSDDIRKTGCSPGSSCRTCSLFGSKCSNANSKCCDGAIGGDSTYSVSLQGICGQSSKTCEYCAPTNSVCGENEASIQCCAGIEDPKSKIKCRKVKTGEFRCVKDLCSANNIVGAVPMAGDEVYRCPGMREEFEFCQCRDLSKGIKNYGQCQKTVCTACGAKGDSCQTNDDCCRGSTNPMIRIELDYECRKNVCTTCFQVDAKQPKNFNCKVNSTIPCCFDDIFKEERECTTDSDKNAICRDE